MKTPTMVDRYIAQLRKDLEPLTSLLWEVLEVAIGETKGFFAARREALDNNLFSHLVRYHAKNELRRRGFQARDEAQGHDASLDVLANNGLQINWDDYPVRILKTSDGLLPVPGESKRKQDYYFQPTLPLLRPDGKPEFRLRHIILWQVDANYDLDKLYLACPKAGEKTRTSVEEHFIEEIPHPATTIREDLGRQELAPGDEDIEVTVRQPKLIPEPNE